MKKIVYKEHREIPLGDIEVSPYNARNEEQYAGIEELKNSIEKFGLISPVVVIEKKHQKGKFELIVGQRRYLAFEKLGRKTIPANVIGDLSKDEKTLVSFAENMHRRELNFNDTMAVCEALFDKYKGGKKERIIQISKDIGISISTISKYLGYKLIPEKVRDLVNQDKINRTQAAKITETFWPDTKKIEAVAKELAGRTRSEWKRALNYSKKKKSASVSEIVEAAEKTETTAKMTIEIDKDHVTQLQRIADNRSKKLQREVEIQEIIEEAISEFINKTVTEWKNQKKTDI